MVVRVNKMFIICCCYFFIQKRIHCRPIQSETDISQPLASETSTIELCLRGDYTVDFSQSDDQHGISIVFQPTNSSIENGRTYKLVCPSSEVSMQNISPLLVHTSILLLLSVTTSLSNTLANNS